tara:strand:- start:432 stop:635 length:204 start_codon:yes stop_codon:yes gene_type:complete
VVEEQQDLILIVQVKAQLVVVQVFQQSHLQVVVEVEQDLVVMVMMVVQVVGLLQMNLLIELRVIHHP